MFALFAAIAWKFFWLILIPVRLLMKFFKWIF